jgi:hypothetical protein
MPLVSRVCTSERVAPRQAKAKVVQRFGETAPARSISPAPAFFPAPEASVYWCQTGWSHYICGGSDVLVAALLFDRRRPLGVAEPASGDEQERLDALPAELVAELARVYRFRID